MKIEIHIILPINHWNQNIRPGNLGSAARHGSGFYTPPILDAYECICVYFAYFKSNVCIAAKNLTVSVYQHNIFIIPFFVVKDRGHLMEKVLLQG